MKLGIQVRGVTWRFVVIGLLLIPLNSYWIARRLMVWGDSPTYISTFYNVIFTVTLLIFLNFAVKMLRRQFALAQIEKTPHDAIELIGNPNGQVQVVAKVRGSDLARSIGRTTWMTEVSMGSDPFYLRARGSACISQPYSVKAWFYTNPLWLSLEGIGKEER